MEIKYCIVFNSDGLDRKWIEKDISKYGKIFNVEEIEDDEDHMTIFYLSTESIADYIMIKIRYNCLSDPTNQYILWPMAEGEKEKALEMLNA